MSSFYSIFNSSEIPFGPNWAPGYSEPPLRLPGLKM